jgi:predicted acetyltransferase
MTGPRLAGPRDAGALYEIWSASFPGDEAFARWFLDAVFEPENALVWDEGGRVLAMLHMLPMHCRIGGRAVAATYVYAVATRPDQRGRGHAAALLEEAVARSRARGAGLIMLVPQSPGLFEYYKKQGFETALFRARRAIRASAGVQADYALEDGPSAAQLNDFYAAALSGRDYVMRTPQHWQRSATYLRTLAARRAGKMLGYAIYEPASGEGGAIRELIASDAGARAALEQGVLSRLGADQAVAFGPDGESAPYGMVRTLDVGLKAQDIYAGLMLD